MLPPVQRLTTAALLAAAALAPPPAGGITDLHWNQYGKSACAEEAWIRGEPALDNLTEAKRRCRELSSTCFGIYSVNCGREPMVDETPCNEADFPDRRKGLICGECKVLADRMGEKYQSCSEYCDSIGRTCVAAWLEDRDKECEEGEALACDATPERRDAICECSADVVSEIPDYCDEGNWPDRDRGQVCDDCKVVVYNFNDRFKTCNGYCQSIGRKCVGGWADGEADNCREEGGEIGCDGTNGDSPDAICQCSVDKVEDEPNHCDEEAWPDIDRGVTCGDCKILVNHFNQYGSCDEYCKSLNLDCVSAANDYQDKCVEDTESEPRLCSTVHETDEDGHCQCSPERMYHLCSSDHVKSGHDLTPDTRGCVFSFEAAGILPPCSQMCTLPGQSSPKTCEEQILDFSLLGGNGSTESTESNTAATVPCERRRQMVSHHKECSMCSACDACERGAASLADGAKFEWTEDPEEEHRNDRSLHSKSALLAAGPTFFGFAALLAFAAALARTRRLAKLQPYEELLPVDA